MTDPTISVEVVSTVYVPRKGVVEAGSIATVPDIPAVRQLVDADALRRIPALTAEQIDALTGDDLQAAAEEHGVDTSTGGSKQDGSLTADETRAALKAKLGVNNPEPDEENS